MSRDAYTRHSEATTATHSSIGSVMSDFDPEHEALVSTQQMDDSHDLPEIGGSLRKQRHYAPPQEEEPDYAINTSAIERAFPEFSQVHTSEEEEDDLEEEEEEEEVSIEVGRGAKKPARRLDDSRNSTVSFENSVRSSSPAVKLDYPAATTSQTPPKSAVRNASAKRATSGGDNLRRDAQIRRASQIQKENADPQASRSPGSQRNEQRRTLSEMHAKVRDTYEGSYVSDERPSGPVVNARTTRFGNARANNVANQVAKAVDRASQEYLNETRRGKTAANSRNPPANATITTNTFPDNTTTHHSFLLPDLPNLSELVSGVFEDGTPVWPRQTKTRTTRFVSPPHDVADVSHTQEHVRLDAVPIPDDEKALFVSLRLLQDKVAELELAKTEAERKLEDVRQENATLKKERSRHQKERYDRRRTYSDEEDDYRRSSGRLASEKNRLEAENLALQNRLDIAERKVQVHETALKNLTRERDMAVSQLGVAYLNSQELKSENEKLRRENAELRAQLAKLTSLTRASTKNEDTSRSREQNHTEQSVVEEEDSDDSQIPTRQTVETTGQDQEQSPSKNVRQKAKTGARNDSRAKVSSQVDKELSRIEKERQDEALFSLDLPYPSRTSTAPRSANAESRSKSETATAKKQPNTSRQRTKKVIVEEVSVSEPLNVNVRGATEEADQDITMLSFIDGREIAQLRKTLEEERIARKQRQAAAARDRTVNETVNSTRQTGPASSPQRKSSLKEPKTKLTRPASAIGEATTTGKVGVDGGEDDVSRAVSERRRRHSDNAVPTPGQRRRRRPVEEMTSAFILPDITFHRNPVDEEHAQLSESAQKALDNMAGHNGKNCMVCKRQIPADATQNHECHITIPKPIPVSQRMPEPSVYNEDPTMRPAQPPALALATVLKGLEDELAHLKMQLATCQNAYNKLDASLSKRQRKSLYGKIDKLLRDIDMKADQIYALYDVLEGQRQNGHELTEQEVEVTLQSIGINVAAARPADLTGATDVSPKKDVEADDDLDDDEELPWEGIESTVETTSR